MADSASSFLDATAPAPKAAAAPKPHAGSFLDEPGPGADHEKLLARARQLVAGNPVLPGSGFMNEVFRGQTFGYGDVIGDAVTKAIHGPEWAAAMRQARDEQQKAFEKNHPYLATAGELVGTTINPVVSGASKLIGKIPAAISRVLKPAAAGTGAAIGYKEGGVKGAAEGALVGRYAVPAVLGGATAALQASGEARPGHRLEAAKEAAIPGAVAGGVLGAGGEILGEAGRALDARTGFALSRGIDRVRSALGATASELSPAERAAANRLRTPAKQDRLSKEGVTKEQEARAAAGAEPGRLQEVGGENTRRVARAAARRMGEGTNEAAALARTKRVNLPTEAAERISRAHPYKGTAEQRVEELRTQRSTEAAQKYRAPYAEPVQLDENAMNVLDNREMRTAMNTAERTAEARAHEDPEGAAQSRQIKALREYFDKLDNYKSQRAEWERSGGIDTSGLPAEARELLDQAQTPAARDRILKALNVKASPEPVAPTPPEVSGGALDRVRIAADQQARSLKTTDPLNPKDTHALGTAVEGRAKALDQYLENVPHLKEARTAYKGKSQQIEAAGSGTKVLSEKPENFREYVKNLSPEARDDLKIAVRDVLMGRAQGKPGQALGVLDALETGAYGQQNLAELFGKDEAKALSEAARFMRQDLQRAQFVAGAGSPTAMNQEDAVFLTKLAHSVSHPTGAVRTAIEDLLKGGYTMSPEEANAIVQFSQGDPMRLLNYLSEHPESPFTGTIRNAVATQFGASSAASQQRVQQDAQAELGAPQ